MSARKEVSTDDIELWYKYEVLGMTQQEIADYYGVSRSCIYCRLHPEYSKEYNQTEEGKERADRYWKSEKGKALKKKKSAKYWKSESGKVLNSKRHALRKGFGFIQLNEPIKNGEWHHIDKEHVICIPEELHRSIPHNVFTGEGMEAINEIAFGYITEEVFDKLIAGEI